jgi:hypothetical protein
LGYEDKNKGERRAELFKVKRRLKSLNQIKIRKKNHFYQTMKISKDNLSKISIIVTAIMSMIAAVLKITHRPGAYAFLIIALLCFIFTRSIKFFKKPGNLRN